MHARHCWIAALALVLVAASAPAQAPPEGGDGADEPARTLEVRTHNANGDYYFTVEGLEGRNPVIVLEAGAEVRVHAVNEGTTIHNVHFGDPIGAQGRLLEPGEEDTFTFRVPADAPTADTTNESHQGYYWCDPHRDLGMVGTVQITSRAPSGTPEEAGGEGDGRVPGPPAGVALLAVAGAAALIGRRRAA